jgi:tetratricopeptide (TPR) repeat protein
VRIFCIRVVLVAVAFVGVSVAHADWEDGVAAYQRGDFAAAEANFAEAVTSNPRYGGSHYMLGLCQERLGKIPEAVASLSKAVELAPDNAQYTIGLAQALNSNGQPDRAYELLTSMDPEGVDSELLTMRALVLAGTALKLGKVEDALHVVEQRVAEDPTNPSLHRAAGMALDRLGRPSDAFDAYARACELNPEDAASCRAAVNAALAVDAQGVSTAERAQIFDRSAELAAALATSSPTPEHLVLAGETSFRAARFDDAANWFEAAYSAGANDPMTLYYWGRSLGSSGQYEEALAKFSSALESGPDSSLAVRINSQLARLAECRFDLEAAARHHRISGNEKRSEEMEALAITYGNAFQRRRELADTIAGLRRTLPQLEDLGDADGQEAISGKIAGLEKELASLDAELASVRNALEKSCPGTN